MKRVISWILVAALMLGFVGMIAFTASASAYTEEVAVIAPDFQVGDAISKEVAVQVSGGTLAEVQDWTNENGEVVTGSFEQDKIYWLNLKITAPDGAPYSYDVTCLDSAGRGCFMNIAEDGKTMEVGLEYDFGPERAQWVELGGMPEEILAGTAQAPALTVVDGHMDVVSAQWVDADKKAVTALETGKVYFLEVKLAPKTGYEFEDWIDVYGYQSAHETEVVNAAEAVAWFRYSLMPSVGKVTLTTSGAAAGKPVTGVKAEVTGDAALAEIRIYDAAAEEMVETGNFEAGKNYRITYVLSPKAGFEFGKDVELECNGNSEMDWYYDDQYLYVTEYFSTCKKIEKVEITVTEPKVGAKIEDAKLTLPKNAPYTATLHWIDMNDYNEATGTFQKGHAYELSLELEPAEGYVFTEDTAVTINGKKISYGGFDGSGLYGWACNEYSFLDKIAKVELPALPAGIKKGDTLSAEFEAPKGANYTISGSWVLYGVDTASKVEADGSYVLAIIASANEGYEFADDAVITVGGKKSTAALNYGREIVLYKAYNIGMKEIDRIDVTVEAPNKGNEPQKPSFGKDPKFESLEAVWMQNTSGNVMDDADPVKTFTVGQYNYLSLVLAAEDGYAFTDGADIYVNGKKAKTVVAMNVGQNLMLVISFGKLTKAGNADTADTMPVGAFVCMGVLALAGMAVTVAGKKKYCA